MAYRPLVLALVLAGSLPLSGCADRSTSYIAPAQRVQPQDVALDARPGPVQILRGAVLTLHEREGGVRKLSADSIGVEPRHFGPFEVSGIQQLRINAMQLNAVLSPGHDEGSTSDAGQDDIRDQVKRLYDRLPEEYGKVTRLIADQPVINIHPDALVERYTRVEAQQLILEFAAGSEAELYGVTLSDSQTGQSLSAPRATLDLGTMQLALKH